MADKIKLFNPQKFDVGIFTLENKIGINIKAGSFALVTPDDIAYIASISDVFRRGILRVEEQNTQVMQEIGIDQANDPNFITDEEIQKKLVGTVKKLKEWLATIEEGYILDRVYDVAVGMNLSMDKIKVLSERMPNKKFLDN